MTRAASKRLIQAGQGDLDGWRYSGAGLLVPAPRSRSYDRPVGVGLFAGAGGMDLGLVQAGIHVAAAVEFDYAAATTYMVNLARPGVKIHFDTPERAEGFNRWLEKHMGNSKDAKGELIATAGTLAGDGWISNQPPWEPGCEHFWVADVRNLTGREILDALGLQPGEVDVCAGGPPCQGYSMAGARNVMDPRNSLVFEFARLVLEIRPKAFIMENVTGMLSMLTPEGVPVIDALCRVLADGGFGSYNALKSGLAAQAGAGAALRRDEQPKKARAAQDDDDDPEDDDEDEQLGLFSLDGAA